MPHDILERPVQFKGSAVARAALRLVGWRVVFAGLPSKQGVLIVYPHTSNWDFVVGLLGNWTMGFPATFWGKDSLFKTPVLGRFMRAVGGVPVDRSKTLGVVADMAQQFARARAEDRVMWLALAPEGTRARREAWRSGFYHVARAANVPLGIAYIDYATKTIGAEVFFMLSGDEDADMAHIAAALAERRGRNHHDAAPIRLEKSPGAGAAQGKRTQP